MNFIYWVEPCWNRGAQLDNFLSYVILWRFLKYDATKYPNCSKTTTWNRFRRLAHYGWNTWRNLVFLWRSQIHLPLHHPRFYARLLETGWNVPQAYIRFVLQYRRKWRQRNASRQEWAMLHVLRSQWNVYSVLQENNTEWGREFRLRLFSCNRKFLKILLNSCKTIFWNLSYKFATTKIIKTFLIVFGF